MDIDNWLWTEFEDNLNDSQEDFTVWEQGKHSKYFTEYQFFELIKLGKVVDARQGGLVVGRSHAEGNIYFFYQDSQGFYEYSNLQGGEYIICHSAAVRYMDRLYQINSYKQLSEPIVRKMNISKASIILNTHGNPEKLLWFDNRGQFIVNHSATAYYFEELEKINFYGRE